MLFLLEGTQFACLASINLVVHVKPHHIVVVKLFNVLLEVVHHVEGGSIVKCQREVNLSMWW